MTASRSASPRPRAGRKGRDSTASTVATQASPKRRSAGFTSALVVSVSHSSGTPAARRLCPLRPATRAPRSSACPCRLITTQSSRGRLSIRTACSCPRRPYVPSTTRCLPNPGSRNPVICHPLKAAMMMSSSMTMKVIWRTTGYWQS
jgi:hypothetical protein